MKKESMSIVQKGRSEPFRVMVVDDVPAIHNDFRKILCPPLPSEDLSDLEAILLGESISAQRRARFEVVSAYQGEDAIRTLERACESEPFTVAFIDVQMPPGINGIETLYRMWKVDSRIQAVICTAHTDKSWEDMVGALGQTDGMLILRKPFDPIEVLQVAHALAYKWELSRRVENHVAELERIVTERTAHLEAANVRLRSEIASREKAESELRRMATHDPLTGIANRILFKERLEHAIVRARRNKTCVGVIMLDLDRFKEINDRHGHAAGDDLLREFAARISRCVRGTDTPARWGGDEFVIVLEDLNGAEGAVVVADRVLESCALPIEVGGRSLVASPSIGIAIFPADGDADVLVRNADAAMYEAKKVGATYRFHTPVNRSSVESEARVA